VNDAHLPDIAFVYQLLYFFTTWSPETVNFSVAILCASFAILPLFAHISYLAAGVSRYPIYDNCAKQI